MATRRQARRLSLLGNLSEVQRRLRYIESQPYSYRLANRVVKRRSIQYRAVANDELDTSAVDNRALAPNAVTSDKVGAGEIKTVNIDQAAVLSGNIGTGQVQNGNIADDAITSNKIKDGEVKTSDIGDGQVTSAKIGSREVKRGNIDFTAVDTPQLAPDAVDRNIIKDGEVRDFNIGDGQVTNAKLAEDSVGTGKIRNGNVTNAKIADGAINNPKIVNGAVDESKLANNSVSNVKIVGSAVTSGKIADDAVINRTIRDGAVTGSKIADNTIGLGKLSFTPGDITGVSAGSGLSGGGSSGSVTLSANFGTGNGNVARGDHSHSQFAHIHQWGVSGGGHPGHSGTNLGGHSHDGITSGPTNSSLRFKTDIENYDFDPTRLLDLDLKRFKYKKRWKLSQPKNSEWAYGYIAEELDSLGFKEITVYDDEGRPEAINYSLLSIFLLELVKKNTSEIESLKTEVRNLTETK